jgi:hypothetical protein
LAEELEATTAGITTKQIKARAINRSCMEYSPFEAFGALPKYLQLHYQRND